MKGPYMLAVNLSEEIDFVSDILCAFYLSVHHLADVCSTEARLGGLNCGPERD